MKIKLEHIKTLRLIFLITSTILVRISYCQNQIDSSLTLFLASTNPVFQDLNPKEANSILANYVHKIVERFNKKYNIKGHAVTKTYASLEDIRKELRLNAINMLNLTTEQYFELKTQFEITACLSSVTYNSKFSQYLLVTNSQSEIKTLADLKGKSIASNSFNRDWLGDMWLNVLLKKNKYPTMDKFFNRINNIDKEKNTVYEVFFKKSDCAIIRKNVLSAMSELNPQLKNSIRIIDSSPYYIVSVLAIYDKAPRIDLIKLAAKEIRDYHKFTEGKQILTLYKVERLDSIGENDLFETKKLIEDYKQLVVGKKSKIK